LDEREPRGLVGMNSLAVVVIGRNDDSVLNKKPTSMDPVDSVRISGTFIKIFRELYLIFRELY
jgi:hypothetical protein